jgi:hypothetical protein
VSKEARTIQTLLRLYQQETGLEEYRMSDAVQYAVDRGFPVPPPISGLERLAKQFSRAANEEIRYDKKTHQPYHANRARTILENGKQIPLWFDMDRAGRPVVEKYSMQRREHVFGEIFQHVLDLDHWNRVHPSEAPVQFELDFTDDVEWRKNAPDQEKEAS